MAYEASVCPTCESQSLLHHHSINAMFCVSWGVTLHLPLCLQVVAISFSSNSLHGSSVATSNTRSPTCLPTFNQPPAVYPSLTLVHRQRDLGRDTSKPRRHGYKDEEFKCNKFPFLRVPKDSPSLTVSGSQQPCLSSESSLL